MINEDLSLIPSDPKIGKVMPQFEIDNEILAKAANYVKSSLDIFESQRTDKSKEFRSQDRAYRGILETDRAYKGLDDKASSLMQDNVETIVARLKESILFDPDNLVKVVSEQIPTQILELRTNEIQDQFKKQDIENKVEALCRILVKFGTAFIKVPFVNTSKQVLTRQLVTTQVPVLGPTGNQLLDENGQPVSQPKQELKVQPEVDRQYFGPGYEVILDAEDVYADLFIEDMQDQPIVIHRVIVNWDHLMDGVKNGQYIEEQVSKIKGQTYRYNTLTTRRSEEVLGQSSVMGFREGADLDSKPKEYELFQAYCEFAIPFTAESGEREFRIFNCTIYTVNEVCIGITPNVFFHQRIPIEKCTYRRIEGEFYGLSAISKPILDAYHEYNDLNNVKNDARCLAVNPIKIVRASSVSEIQDFPIAPGSVWIEKNPGDIRFANFDWTPIQNAEQELEILEQRINRGMGITPLMQGSGDATDLDKTWRGTNKLIAQADKKFKMIAKAIEDCAIRRVAELFYKVNIQFNPIVQELQFQRANMEVGFEVKGVESFFEQQEGIQRMGMFLTQFGTQPGMNTAGLTLTLADEMGVKIDPEKYGPLYTPPQPPPPEEKPLGINTSISIDPSKGEWMKYAAAQILAQKNIALDLDGIRAGQEIDNQDKVEIQTKSGNLPPQHDSYRKSDPRSVKGKK